MKSHKSKALKREPVEKNAGEGKRENQRQVRIAWLSSSSMTSIINYRDFGRVLRKNRFLRFFCFCFCVFVICECWWCCRCFCCWVEIGITVRIGVGLGILIRTVKCFMMLCFKSERERAREFTVSTGSCCVFGLA